LNPAVRDQFEVFKVLVVADEEIRKLDLELMKERDSLEGVKKDLVRVREQIEQERQQYDVIENDRGARIQEGRVMQQQL
jgi:hypothetical protein